MPLINFLQKITALINWPRKNRASGKIKYYGSITGDAGQKSMNIIRQQVLRDYKRPGFHSILLHQMSMKTIPPERKSITGVLRETPENKWIIFL